MVLIQILDILLLHQAHIQRIQIDRHIRQILELHKLTILILLRVFADDHIFCTDSMASFNINTRLIGTDHTGFQNRIIHPLRNHLETDSIWTLMDIQQISHTMSGSVIII